jgi:RNA polymerase sigma factor (sigma-70 family)
MSRKKQLITIAPGTRTERDSDAFERVYRLYEPTMRQYLRRHYVTDQHACEDILQDVFTALWEVLPAIDLERVRNFLFRCVRNRAVDYLRHRAGPDGRALSLQYAASTEDGEGSEAEEYLSLPGRFDGRPEESAIMRETLREVRDALGLHPRIALVATLFFDLDMSHAQILDALKAAGLEVSINAIKGDIHTARRRLARAIQAEHHQALLGAS